jgi:hypothetical protein
MEVLDINLETDSPAQIIEKLRRTSFEIPQWADLEKDFDPKQHKIMTDSSRNDKVNEDGTVDRMARIPVALEKLLVKRMVEFLFAIPVKRTYSNYDENDATSQEIIKAIESVFTRVRIDAENIKRGRSLYSSCEMVTIWYAVDKKHSRYGFKAEKQLKCKSYSQKDGYRIYPLVDIYDDMKAISFEYKKKEADKDVTIFESYLEINGGFKHLVWMDKGKGFEEDKNEDLAIAKIPCIYGCIGAPIWDDLTNIRDDIEYTLSRNSDTIAYNSAPVLKVEGEMEGGAEKRGKSQRIVRVKEGGDVAYVSWQQSIEAIKHQIEILIDIYFMQAQLPDLSFKNMKSLGSIGFDARQTLLTDAHLKVGDEKSLFIEFLDREVNVVKEFLKSLNEGWADKIDDIEVENVITPFIQNDIKSMVDMLLKATGGEAIMPVLEAIKQLGWTTDAQKWLDQLTEEQKKRSEIARVKDVFQGAE